MWSCVELCVVVQLCSCVVLCCVVLCIVVLCCVVLCCVVLCCVVLSACRDRRLSVHQLFLVASGDFGGVMKAKFTREWKQHHLNKCDVAEGHIRPRVKVLRGGDNQGHA